MHRRAVGVLLISLSLAAVLLSGCGQDEGDQVVARVGRVNITERELRQKLAELPPFTRQQFQGPEGTIDFLERLVEEEVLYQAAVKAGYEDDPDVKRTLEAIKRRSMIQAYYKGEIEEKVEVPEEDVQAYFDEHDEQFQRVARIKFRHIMAPTRSQAEEGRRRVLAGEDFASVARDASTDSGTREAGGLMKSVNVGNALPTLGMDEAFLRRLYDDWRVGQVTEPLRSNNGWHVIVLEERIEAGTKPLDEVRDSIVQSLMPAKTREYYDAVLEELKDQHRAEINEGAFRTKPRTEEELFTLAQDTDDPLERLNFYSELVFNYPDGDHAAEAQFMIGFIHAEELNNEAPARNAFRRVIEEYPDSDLVDSAQWMMDNMGSEEPPFEESDVLSTD